MIGEAEDIDLENNDFNFDLTVSLKAGATYAVEIFSPTDNGIITVTVEKDAHASDATVLNPGSNTVTINEKEATVCQFTPDRDGNYRFRSEGECDPEITLLDGSDVIGSNDGIDKENINFDLALRLQGGRTYTAKIASNDDGNIAVTVEKVDRPATPLADTDVLECALLTATNGSDFNGSGSERCVKALDRDTSTKWCVVGNLPCWVESESDVHFVPKGYAFTTGSDNGKYIGRNPSTWTLMAKADADGEWTTLDDVAFDGHMQDVNETRYDFALSAGGAFRYFRLEIAQTQNDAGIAVNANETSVMQLSELALWREMTYDVSIDENITNGTVKLAGEQTRFFANETVALTVAPDDGFALETLTVNGEDVTDKVSEGTYTFAMPGENVSVSATFTPVTGGITAWAALQQQIDEAEDGAVITLEEDLTVTSDDSYLNIPNGKTVTLNLNGHTLDRGLADSEAQQGGWALMVSGTLNLEGEGIITGANAYGVGGGGIYVSNNHALNMRGGTITGNHSTGDCGGDHRRHGAALRRAEGRHRPRCEEGSFGASENWSAG